MKKILFILFGISVLAIELKAQTVTDIDGNSYNTVNIGNQIWLKENLKTSRFSNGDLIPTSVSPVDNDSTCIYEWCYDDDTSNFATYGLLYSWFVVSDNRNVCPVGWHVPDENELNILSNFLGGDSVAGDKMKETGTIHWSSSNTSVTNSSNFTALPGGFRGNPSGYINLGASGHFWTSTPWGSNSFQRGVIYLLTANSGVLAQSVAVANCGLSVRCVNDLAAITENIINENKIQIFPNPTKEFLYIEFDEIGNYKASIYDEKGALVFQKNLSDKMNTLNIGFLTKGIYILQIENEGSRIERKIIVE